MLESTCFYTKNGKMLRTSLPFLVPFLNPSLPFHCSSFSRFSSLSPLSLSFHLFACLSISVCARTSPSLVLLLLFSGPHYPSFSLIHTPHLFLYAPFPLCVLFFISFFLLIPLFSLLSASLISFSPQTSAVAFRGLNKDETSGLYACVGLRSPNEEVEVNLGASDFVFDVQSYISVSAGCWPGGHSCCG